MKKNGYTAMELLVVIAALGIATIIILFSTSSAFKDDSTTLYEEKKYLIEHQAEKYGQTLTNLESEGTLIILLDDVIKGGYYIPDTSDGKVVDPRNKNNTLNGLKIKLAYNEGNIIASVIDDE